MGGRTCSAARPRGWRSTWRGCGIRSAVSGRPSRSRWGGMPWGPSPRVEWGENWALTGVCGGVGFGVPVYPPCAGLAGQMFEVSASRLPSLCWTCGSFPWHLCVPLPPPPPHIHAPCPPTHGHAHPPRPQVQRYLPSELLSRAGLLMDPPHCQVSVPTPATPLMAVSMEVGAWLALSRPGSVCVCGGGRGASESC